MDEVYFNSALEYVLKRCLKFKVQRAKYLIPMHVDVKIS